MPRQTKIDPRILKAFQEQNGFDLSDHCIVLARVGSHSHGTYVPPQDPTGTDDVDFMGFVIPPLDYHVGLKQWEHWVFQFEELDVVLYSLEKAFRLLLKSNPNIMGMLWLREQDYIHKTFEFDAIREKRYIFSSLTAVASFSGYATSQLQKMETFDLKRMNRYEELTRYINYWKLDRQKVLNQHPDKMEDILTNFLYAHPDSAHDYGGLYDDGVARSEVADLLREFRKLHKEYFGGYMGDKRKSLVRKHGYDTKNAAHLLRLLVMACEFVSTGKLNVYREIDREELIRIKQGEWSLDDVKSTATRLFNQVQELAVASTLPKEPDFKAANDLLRDTQWWWLMTQSGT